MSSKEPQLMIGSAPLHTHQSTKNTTQNDNENSNKVITKFPPISKPKLDQTSKSQIKKIQDTPNMKESTKQNIKDNQGSKKVIDDGKRNLMVRKKGQKKKAKVQIRPQVLEKYKLMVQYSGIVNLSNSLRVTVSQKLPNYVLYVGKGNNSSLIKSLFRTYRPWWTIQENNPDNPSINLYWYQLRQNKILDDIKDNNKIQADFQGNHYYIDEQKQQQIKQEKKQEKKQDKDQSTKSMHKTAQMRSQSVTQKDIRNNFKLGLQKRSSSKTKGVSLQKGGIVQALSGIKNDIKDQIQLQQGKKKKVLANTKMWPIYHIYRRLLSQSELKQLKKLKVITEEGRLGHKLGRAKLRVIENRSNHLRMHNHLTANWNLSNKKALFSNLKIYYQAQKINPFDFIPMTFHVNDPTDPHFLRFQQQFHRRAENIKQQQRKQKGQQLKYGFKPKKRNAWLVKPGQNTNRGTGIEVVQSLQQIRAIIQKQTTDKQGRPRTHILQQYIMPFLYQKRKFDIRVYVCLASINGYMKGYWCQDGYIRTASKQFNMKNLNNKFIHLTNDAVQKYHEDYGKFEPANKLSFADFQRYLDTVYNTADSKQKLKFYQSAYPQMKKLAADALRSVYTKINPTKKQFTFEVFGLDFLIDQNFKVWLIQANTNPCLELACPLLGRVIPTMLEHAFRLVVDPLFPPPPIQDVVTMSKKITLPQNPLEGNRFQLIFDQVQQGKQLKALLSNAPPTELKIEQVDEQQQQYDENFNQCGKQLQLN